MTSVEAFRNRAQSGEYTDNPMTFTGDVLAFYAESSAQPHESAKALALSGLCLSVETAAQAQELRERIGTEDGPLLESALNATWAALARSEEPETITKQHETLSAKDDEWLFGEFSISSLGEKERLAFNELTLMANRKIGRKTALPQDEIDKIIKARETFFRSVGLDDQWIEREYKQLAELYPPYNMIQSSRILHAHGVDIGKLHANHRSIRLASRSGESIKKTLDAMKPYAEQEALASALVRYPQLFSERPNKLEAQIKFLQSAGIDISAVYGAAPAILTYSEAALQPRIDKIYSLGFGLNCSKELIADFINFWPGIISTSDKKLEFVSLLGNYLSDRNQASEPEFRHLKKVHIIPLGRLLSVLTELRHSGREASLALVNQWSARGDFSHIKDSFDLIDELDGRAPQDLLAAFSDYLSTKNSKRRPPKTK